MRFLQKKILQTIMRSLMNRVIYIILPLFFMSPVLLSQDKWDDDARIDDKEIVIEKSRTIELPVTNKNYEKIPALPIKRDYAMNPFEFKD